MADVVSFLIYGSRHLQICLLNPYSLITAQLRNSPAHLLVIVDMKALLFSNASQLDILRIQFLLHDLFQRFQYQGLGLGQRQRTMVFIL